tara:strand:+ start:507 stop:785 length:279 start_codon:yes stop_codon:yes gene_type:complete
MKAIYALYPNAVTIREEVDGSIEVTDNNGNEIEINMTQVNAWVDPEAYKYARQAAYPPMSEQLDMQYWDSVNNTTTWEDAIAKVKADNPKPE